MGQGHDPAALYSSGAWGHHHGEGQRSFAQDLAGEVMLRSHLSLGSSCVALTVHTLTVQHACYARVFPYGHAHPNGMAHVPV